MESYCKNCDHRILSNYREDEWEHFRMKHGKPVITKECKEWECECKDPLPKGAVFCKNCKRSYEHHMRFGDMLLCSYSTWEPIIEGGN